MEVLIEPKDLTQEEINHVLKPSVFVGVKGQKLNATSYRKISDGLLNVTIKNLTLAPGETLLGALRMRYEAYPSQAYIDTANRKSFIGGVTG